MNKCPICCASAVVSLKINPNIHLCESCLKKSKQPTDVEEVEKSKVIEVNRKEVNRRQLSGKIN